MSEIKLNNFRKFVDEPCAEKNLIMLLKKIQNINALTEISSR